jgi:hypothetical protein
MPLLFSLGTVCIISSQLAAMVYYQKTKTKTTLLDAVFCILVWWGLTWGGIFAIFYSR